VVDQPLSDRAKVMLVWPVAGFFVVIAFGIGLVSMSAFDNQHGTAPTATAAAATASGDDEVEIELGDLFIKPAMIHAAEGSVIFDIHNGGGTEHNFIVEGVGATDMIKPGGTAELTVDLAAGDYRVICAVPGHADAGMTAQLMVGGQAASAGSEDPSASAGMSGMSAKEMVAHDAERTAMFPAKTKGKGGIPLAPKVMRNGVKRFELTADEIEWETEPGVVKHGMAYNGMIPGPQIRVNVGDKVEIVLHNELDEPTTLHLHGMTVPNDMDGVPGITQDAIMPGDSFTYKFTVRNAGSNMYHSHFNAVQQVPGGLLGALIVSDRKDRGVDIDYTMVLNDGPLGFTLNGKGFPATEPIVAHKGQLVRIRYMNEGLQIHPMHLHGLAQRVVAKDGHLLKHPYLADTVLVAPGERYDVLVRATEEGTWAFHCHILSHAEGPNGMFGMVTAMVVH
jgi:manganese oxidase